MEQVLIDSSGDLQYQSFYIYGLEKLFGKRNVSFSSEPFRTLSDEVRLHNFRFIILDETIQKRAVIATQDSFQIVPELYDWCDVYGSVNANRLKTESQYQKKLVALCPSFGVRCWNLAETLTHMLSHLDEAKPSSFKKFIRKYKHFLRRQSYEHYIRPKEVKNNYLFLCSTLWTNDEWNRNDETVNLTRARFIRACKTIKGLSFEGGFVPSKTSSNELFKDCLCVPYSTHQWLQKTQQSVCVFNTPAYWQCHGWKLGEYMALGKAIISTPISNDLPAPLIHGKHIHIVENSQEAMREAVSYILSHPDYRKSLEHNISAYWDTYGTPQKSLELLGL